LSIDLTSDPSHPASHGEQRKVVPGVVDIAIVGAGAAGLATAIFTRRLNPARSVVLLEGAKRPGAKILVSGGGRCNVTNTVVADSDFWGGRRTIIRQILRAFPANETVSLFRSLGVPLHEESDGKLFPDSNRARDVLEALLREAASAGVTLLAGHRVHDVRGRAGAFTLDTSHGVVECRAVALATGGQSLPKSGSDGAGYRIAARLGHSIVPVTPGLAPLRLHDDERLHFSLAGVAHGAELTLWLDGAAAIKLTGSMLWTHFGISGPVALNMSRHWARAALERRPTELTMSFVPAQTFEQAEAHLVDAARDHPRASVRAVLATLMPAAAARALLDALAMTPDAPLAHLQRDARRRIVHAFTRWRLPVVETRGFNYAEVTAGGVSLSEIDPATMESRRCPGLYLVGEMLDVDGRLGGFNFQWAWSSARAAARGLAL
jgi:predicted Rossmann fold flavoprotein